MKPNCIQNLQRWTAFVVGLLLVPTAVSCFGWGDGGHMIVAKIAYDRLNKTARAEADRLLALKIKPVSKTLKSLDFIQASHWPDDVRPLPDFSYTAEYHFIDFPFTQDGTDLPSDLPKEENAIKALEEYLATLQNGNDDSQKAEALRFVIHLVGDIHQPLHCASRISGKFPEGDRGGNELHITEIDPDGTKHRVKLHAFWDAGMETFPKMGAHFQPPPVSDIVAAASALRQKYPDNEGGWEAGGPYAFDAWAAESFQLCKHEVYKGLTARKPVSQAYIDRCTPIAEQRVVWAGYRLARLLNTVWPEHNTTQQDPHPKREVSNFQPGPDPR